jgi:hypothetical protein
MGHLVGAILKMILPGLLGSPEFCHYSVDLVFVGFSFGK